eukprot:908364-Prymnesium_polylepis.2
MHLRLQTCACIPAPTYLRAHTHAPRPLGLVARSWPVGFTTVVLFLLAAGSAGVVHALLTYVRAPLPDKQKAQGHWIFPCVAPVIDAPCACATRLGPERRRSPIGVPSPFRVASREETGPASQALMRPESGPDRNRACGTLQAPRRPRYHRRRAAFTGEMGSVFGPWHFAATQLTRHA